jgi:hypothetical protein
MELLEVAGMYLPKVHDPVARTYRVRYAIANILRDRVTNEGAFNTCFEMEDAEEVIGAILRRGLKNPRLRTALERSHLVNLAQWLAPRPEFSEAYYSTEASSQRTLKYSARKASTRAEHEPSSMLRR